MKHDRYLKKREVEPMTCIIGAKCSNGIVVTADRRIMRGLESTTEDKLFVLGRENDPKVILGASGLTGIMDRFVPSVMNAIVTTRAQSLWQVINEVEDIAKNLSDRYSDRIRGEASQEKQQGLIDVFVSGLEGLIEGDAKLYHCYENGFAEEVRQYDILGHGAPYALPFVKLLYDPQIPAMEMANVSACIILTIEKLEVDQSVGGLPDAAILENGNTNPSCLDENAIRSMERHFTEHYGELKTALRNLWCGQTATASSS